MRSRNPTLILCFLQEAFKAEQYSPTLSHERLAGHLADFLETWITTEKSNFICIPKARK
ncbi:hypothetical protein [Spirosoma panaciterrae]|uniref:hypothetical protein n=1 Tax=Spirosoma panaciterrae TaxID=496058 RepID=UPI000375C43E|nr:hypothetical protein [Spirosoma panaciterrae]